MRSVSSRAAFLLLGLGLGLACGGAEEPLFAGGPGAPEDLPRTQSLRPAVSPELVDSNQDDTAAARDDGQSSPPIVVAAPSAEPLSESDGVESPAQPPTEEVAPLAPGDAGPPRDDGKPRPPGDRNPPRPEPPPAPGDAGPSFDDAPALDDTGPARRT